MIKNRKAKDCEYQSAFSIQVRKILKDNNLTQTQLAKAIGLNSVNSVNEWLTKKGRKPEWLLPLFGVIKFFYENVKGFNPMQLFFIEEINLKLNGDIQTLEIEKVIEQRIKNGTEKITMEYEKRIKKIIFDYDKQLESFKTDPDKLLIKTSSETIAKLKNEINKFQRKLEKAKLIRDQKYEVLKENFKNYRESYNLLKLSDLSFAETYKLSDKLSLRLDIGVENRAKRLLTNPEFLNLIAKAFKQIRTPYDMAKSKKDFLYDIGYELYKILYDLKPKNPDLK